MKKACLIIPYYGKWPTYLPIYLNSCANNQWLDILFFTDIEITPQHPENVKFINLPIQSLERRISETLNIKNYILPNSYKLCDLKPIYGLIFQNEIKNYNYWGFGDCDLIYGNLLKFIESDLKTDTDVISFNEQRNSGSLMLLKNLDILNKIYLKIENYKVLVQQPNYIGMDEVCHNWNEINKLNLSKSSLTYWIAKETKEGIITSSFVNRITEEVKSNDLISYENGKVFFNKKEIAYFHYVCNKNKPYFSFPVWENIPTKFYINEIGFLKNKINAIILRFPKKYLSLFIFYLKKAAKR